MSLALVPAEAVVECYEVYPFFAKFVQASARVPASEGIFECYLDRDEMFLFHLNYEAANPAPVESEGP